MINCVSVIWKLIKKAIKISQIQHFEADFLSKVSLKILYSGLILKTFTHVHTVQICLSSNMLIKWKKAISNAY